MAQQLPAFHGTFGSTEFWVVTMKAGELIRTLTVPKEMEGWEDLNPEERFQRDIDYKRVAKYIAPYLSDDPDRFLGAFIVAVHQHEEMQFESLIDAGIRFPKALSNSLMNQFGILYLSGGEVLIPLDGQHRLAALKFSIEGKDNTGKELPNVAAKPEVGGDVCTAIMIRHDPPKARKIFNKVNRYAKPTTKGDNLITSDDDYIAVIAREDVVGDFIPSRVVNIKSNTLSKRVGFFTTLATIYEISLSIEIKMTGHKPDVSKPPKEADINLARTNIKQFWEEFLKVTDFQDSLINPQEDGDENRAEIREASLACRPIVQRALAEAIILLTSEAQTDGTILGYSDCVDKINSVDWNPEIPTWQGILLNGDKVITGNTAMKFAARIIAYLLGHNIQVEELQKLKEQFAANTDGKELPTPEDCPKRA